jgi:hypothetical protein
MPSSRLCCRLPIPTRRKRSTKKWHSSLPSIHVQGLEPRGS